MILETATITFYRIHKCGYYGYGDLLPAFGNCAEMLTDLASWAEGKSFKQTKTYEGNDEVLPTYLLDMKRADDNVVLLLWNEVPSTDQSVPSVQADAEFGESPDVILNSIEPGSIPGFATYFWFVPSMNLVASIKLNHALTGQKAMQVYLHSFLKQSSSHVVAEMTDQADGTYDIVIKGYKVNPDDDSLPKKKHRPQFSVGLVRNPGKHDFIRQRANSVSKIEKIVELDVSKAEDYSLWQKLLIGMRVSQAQSSDVSTKIKYELSPEVDIDDINGMIDDWNDNHDTNSCDYGFTFSGDSKKYWLSRSLARTQFPLNLERRNAEFVTSASLLNELVGKRELILREAGV
ncbi:hypothetical protein MQ089_08355 [Edwardsiella anguillarum]|uniref:hypothetical protein n=1 Tax=Edwardsiella anguillarum TaxID=1821960 RepID=UPI0024B7904A|nr:hypothetical protein [Edwardsiella anguillarum]WHP81820.1 hypothetical protein MQ090_08335 [Edwardsiella anguillarum]WHQ19323.1 hypothetical protein MQ085_08365 [Edwardsiella anguillarum]WHQ22867.1 hypothetical protein MQ089_08355 [Edwardsiella anguillarum]WHQ26393.1 hypothetical protein MQ094_08370 [Edwardsiella anguillarum]WHQ29906.1 hypothetical protein MQ093_08340 [Edwardsiella anguillarum]